MSEIDRAEGGAVQALVRNPDEAAANEVRQLRSQDNLISGRLGYKPMSF